MAAVASAVTNILLTLLVKLLVPCVRPESKSLTIRLNMLVLLAATFLNTVMIPLLLNSSIYGVVPARALSFVFNLSKFQFYGDYTSSWYYYIGPYFMNFMVVSLANPFIQLAVTHLLSKFHHWRARALEGQAIQKELNDHTAAFTLDVASELSNTLLLIFLAMTFSTGMPVINLLCFLSLCLKYLSLKYLLFYYSVRVQGLNETVNIWLLRILPVALVIHILMGSWMLTSPDIFTKTFFSKFMIDLRTGLDFLDRIFLVPFMLALIALIALYIMLELIASCFSAIRECASPKPEGELTARKGTDF